MVLRTRRALPAHLLALLGRQHRQHLRFEADAQQRAVGDCLAECARRGTGAGFVELRRGTEGAQRFLGLAFRLCLGALPGRGGMHDCEQLVLLGFAQVQPMQAAEQAEAARAMGWAIVWWTFVWGTVARRPCRGRPIQARYTGPGSTETLISETLISETALRALARCPIATLPLAGGGIGTPSGTRRRIGLAGRKNRVGASGGEAGDQQRCR